MDNYELFKKFMIGLGETFDKEISKTLLDIYWSALENFTDEQCRNAFNKTIVSCKFFPKPVEIIELTGSGGKLEDIAQIQADIVINTIRKIGAYQSVKFKDGITIAVIQNCYGGWVKVCDEILEANEHWFRKDFIRYYQSYSRQNITSNDTLCGFVYLENTANGYEEFIPEPIFIDSLDLSKIKLIGEK